MNKQKLINVVCAALFSLGFVSSNAYASTLSYEVLDGANTVLTLSFEHNIHSDSELDLAVFNQDNSLLTVVWSGDNTFNFNVGERRWLTTTPTSPPFFETTFIGGVIDSSFNYYLNSENTPLGERYILDGRVLPNGTLFSFVNGIGDFRFRILDTNGNRVFADYTEDNTQIGNIAFTGGNPSVVPVPAAAWLFGSALLGFFGFSRRKKLS